MVHNIYEAMFYSHLGTLKDFPSLNEGASESTHGTFPQWVGVGPRPWNPEGHRGKKKSFIAEKKKDVMTGRKSEKKNCTVFDLSKPRQESVCGLLVSPRNPGMCCKNNNTWHLCSSRHQTTCATTGKTVKTRAAPQEDHGFTDILDVIMWRHINCKLQTKVRANCVWHEPGWLLHVWTWEISNQAVQVYKENRKSWRCLLTRKTREPVFLFICLFFTNRDSIFKTWGEEKWPTSSHAF